MLTHGYVGNTIEIEIDIVGFDGESLDVSTCDFTFSAATSNGDFLIQKTDIDGIDIIEEVTGRIRVTIAPEDTVLLLVPRNLWWDCRMTDEFGDVRTIANGRIALSMPVASLVL